MGILSIITGLSDFKTKLDEYQNESMSRLGTAGYDSTVEYWADFIGAVV